MSLFQQGMSQVTEESMKAAESNVIPAGSYNIECQACEMRENENTGKKSISMKFVILGPTQAKRVFFQNFYCFSDNDEHNKKQFDRLGVFASRAGIEKERIPTMDLGDFVGLRAACQLKIQKSTGYDDKNEISHFKHLIDEVAEAASNQGTEATGDGATPF